MSMIDAYNFFWGVLISNLKAIHKHTQGSLAFRVDKYQASKSSSFE